MAIKSSPDIEATVCSQYESGKGVVQIACDMRLHRSTVQRILLRAGYELRKRSPDALYNIHFFDEITPESAYWAGFFMADGHVHKNRQAVDLHLATIDREHLERFAAVIQYSGNIQECNDNSCRLQICGPWFHRSLQTQFNVVPCKTESAEVYTIMSPVSI